MSYKICIWMNIPSHYQSAFFNALARRSDVELKVIYLHGADVERIAEGWDDVAEPEVYELFSRKGAAPVELLAEIPDWRDWVHIVSANFFEELVDWFCTHGARWCHWSEMPGIRLAERVGFRPGLFRLLRPAMLVGKRAQGRRINRYALGALAQGRLASRAFRIMGVRRSRIADLYYAPDGLRSAEPCRAVVDFASGRKVFLAVGALCKRKGTDLLLKAFSRIDSRDWCLVLCGLDRSGRIYRNAVDRLGFEQQVLFLGAYPARSIAEVYAAADVLVHASRFDGWGAVINEAASVGLPIVGTDLSGASWHIIEDGTTGYRVRAGSVPALSRAMQRYVESPERIQRQGAAAMDRFQREYTPDRNAERLIQAIEEWQDS